MRQRKKGGKDQESIQSSTTPNPGYHMASGPETLKAGHHWPVSETPFEWRFAGGPMVARHYTYAG